MNAPDRSAAVLAYYASHPEHFTADRHDENRRRSLPALIAHLETVSPADRGRWGVLVKTDRNNKIPCDVIVWKDTGEHFDIMTSTGGMWASHGPISVNGGGAWFWAPASVVDANGEERALQGPPFDGGTPPIPEPEPAPTRAIDLTPLLAKVDALSADVVALRDLVQQLLDRPAPAVTVPPIEFPSYEGMLRLGPLGNQTVTLRPKPD
jgi:hypothetical protein